MLEEVGAPVEGVMVEVSVDFEPAEVVDLGVFGRRVAVLGLILGAVGDFGVEVGIDGAFGFWVPCGASTRGFWIF